MTKLKLKVVVLETIVFLTVQAGMALLLCGPPILVAWWLHQLSLFYKLFFGWSWIVLGTISLFNVGMNLRKSLQQINEIADIRITVDLANDATEEPTPVHHIEPGIN